jgi:DNA-binding transcriptional ArsR family regulator
MQMAEITPIIPGPTITVAPSLAVDLSWSLHAATSPTLRQRHPVLTMLYEDHPALAERVRGFWKGDLCFTELQILAYRADALLLTEPEELFSAIERACVMPAIELPLLSETDEDRQAILERIGRLRRSAKLRTAYVDLLRDVWAVVGGLWAKEGLVVAEAASTDYRQQVAHGTEWQSMVPTTACAQINEALPDLVERRRSGGKVFLVSCYFFGTGLILDLPDVLIIGVSAVRNDIASRARTELLARRLKTLADPTRLAILDYLHAGSRAVGEIARDFGLAQPTVSMHVKHLREAGMVSAARTGTRLELTVDQDAVLRFLDDLKTVVAPGQLTVIPVSV